MAECLDGGVDGGGLLAALPVARSSKSFKDARFPVGSVSARAPSAEH